MPKTPLAARIALYCVVAAVLGFLVLPILAIVPSAFSDVSYLRIPPESYSTRWFAVFFDDPEWRSSLWTSIQIATGATILAVILGTLAALGLDRLSEPWKTVGTGLFLAPMIVPVIVTAVALYFLGQQTGLVGTKLGMAAGHTLLCLPFVVINVAIALRSIDGDWLRAAQGLGAGGPTIFRTIILPNIVPGILGGTVFSFITSFDEVVVSIFLAGYGAKTLPVKMWETIRLEFTPVVAVAALFMIMLTVLPFVLTRFFGTEPGSAP